MIEYIKIALQADPVGLVKGFAEADTAIKKFHATYQATANMAKAGAGVFNKMSEDLKTFGKTGAAAGLSLSAGYLASIKLAMDFQTQQKNVQSLTKESNEEIKAQQEAIFEMSRNLPQTPVELASATYDIASSGYQGAEATQILEASAVAASAGLSSAAVASKAIVAGLNAYGLEAKDAADLSDILFQAVNVGVMTFEQMAGSMGQWVGMAAQVGVAADEAAAAIATMTLAGISADEAATYLSRLMETFLQPSEAMKQTVQEIGYANAEALLDTEGLGGALFKLEEAVAGDQTAFMSLFPSIQAARGAMAILSAEGQNWERTSTAIMDKNARAGAAMEAYEVQSQSLAIQLKKLFNQLKIIGIKIGEAFVGPLKFITGVVSKIIGLFDLIPQSLMNWVVRLTAIGAVIMTVGGLFLSFGASLVISKIAFLGMAAAITKVGTALASMRFMSGLSSMFMALGGRMKAAGSIFKMITGSIVTGARVAAAAFNYWKGGVPILTALRMAMGTTASAGVALSTVFRMLAGALPYLGFAAVAYGLFSLHRGLKQAREEGEKAARTFGESLDTSSFSNMKQSLNDVNKELKTTELQLQDLDSEGIGGLMMSMVNPFDGAREKLVEEKTGYLMEMETMRVEIEDKASRMKGLAVAAWLSSTDQQVVDLESFVPMPHPNKFVKDILAESEGINSTLKSEVSRVRRDFEIATSKDQANAKDPLELLFGDKFADTTAWGFEALGKDMSSQMWFSVEKAMYDIERLAKAQGIELDDIIKVGGDQDAAKKLAQTWKEFRKLSPAARDAKISFLEMGEAADESASNVDKLHDALTKTVDAALGYESARDALQGLVNDTYQAVKDIKEAGTLQEAMDLDSFHEDALALRGHWGDIVQGMVDDTTQWAAGQGEVTGPQIEAHLQDQITMMRKYGAEMGLSTEFVEHFVGVLQQVSDENLIAVHFEDNTEVATAKVEAYISKVLGTPENIETAARLYKEQGEKALRDWMHSIGVVDEEQINNYIELHGKQARSELDAYLTDLDIANKAKFIQTVIQLSQEYGPGSKELLDYVKGEGVTKEELPLVLDLIGETDSLQQMVLLKQVTAELGETPTKVTVIPDTDAAEGELKHIQSLLKDIERERKAKVTIETQTRELGIGSAPGYNPSGTTGSEINSTQGRNRTGGNPYGKGGSGPAKKEADGGVLNFYAGGGFFSEGAHVAQMAKAGDWRVWAEPETGGEAYIPLSPQKRTRSMVILNQVADEFGVKVVEAANGGVIRYAGGGMTSPGVTSYAKGGVDDPLESRFRPPSKEEQEKEAKKKKDDAEAAKKEVEKAEDERIDRIQQTIEISEFKLEMAGAPAEHYVQLYKGFVGQFKPYSDEWMDLQRKIKEAQDKMKEDQIAWVDSIIGLGHVSLLKQVDILQKRAENEATFSTKWFEIAREFVERRDTMMEKMFEAKAIGKDQYLAYLNERLRGVEMYSDDWFDLTAKIKDINKEAADEELKRQRQMNEVGDTSDSAYLAFLRQRLVTTEKFSDEYMEIWNDIQAMEQDALRKSANLFDKFNNRMNVSSKSIIGWLKKQIKQAQAFRDTMNKLAESGQYSDTILGQVEAMGPSGLGLARGLLQGAGTQGGQEIVGLLETATTLGIQTGSYDRGGYLMPGLTLAYNGTGAPERVGNQESKTVVYEAPALNVEHMTVSDQVDVDMISKRTAFAVRTRRL